MKAFDLEAEVKIDIASANASLDTLITKAKELNNELNSTPSVGGTSGGTSGGAAGGTSGGVSSGKTNVANTALDVALTVSSAGAYKFLKELGSKGIEQSSIMETSASKFATYMKATPEEGMAFAESLREFAKDTPLGLEDVLKATDYLMAAGIEADDVINKLTVLGNLVQGDSERLIRATKAYTDIRGYDQLNAQEKRQLIENGVYIETLLREAIFGSDPTIAGYEQGYNYIKDKFYSYDYEGATKHEKELLDLFDSQETPSTIQELEKNQNDIIKTLMKEHFFTEQDIWNAMVWGQEEGSFNNAMFNRMETFAGKQEKLGDSFSYLGQSVVETSGLKTLLGNGMTFLSDLFESEAKRLYEYGWFYWKEPFIEAKKGIEQNRAFWESISVPYGEGVGEGSEKDRIWSLLEPYLNNPAHAQEALDAFGDYQHYNDLSYISDFLDDFYAPEEVESIIQSAIQSSIPPAISEGFKGAKVQVTVGTGNIVLDSGMLVGALTPKVNVSLGGLLGNA